MNYAVHDADGIEILDNSIRAYGIFVGALIEMGAKLDELGPIVPDVLRPAYDQLGSALRDVRGDARMILEDLERWDGDHDKAMTERDFRRGGKAKKGKR